MRYALAKLGLVALVLVFLAPVSADEGVEESHASSLIITPLT